MKYALPWEKRNKDWCRMNPEGNFLVSIRYYPKYKRYFLVGGIVPNTLDNFISLVKAKQKADEYLKNLGFTFLTPQLANMS